MNRNIDDEKLYKEALMAAKEYIKNNLDEEDGEYSTIEEQYIELREVAKRFIPDDIFRRLITKHNKNRCYSL